MQQSTTTRRPRSGKLRTGARGRTTAKARFVRNVSVVNLLAVVGLLILLFAISERWWFSAALTYLPRTPFVLPAIALLAASLVWHRRSCWLNIVAIVVLVGPVAGLRVPIPSDRPNSESDITVVSCNVQGFQPDFATVLQEIAAVNPDAVAFQEALVGHPLLETFFADWHVVHVGPYWIGSKYPMRLIAKCDSAAFDRMTAVKVEIEGPSGKFHLTNLHQMTARRGLSELNVRSIFSGEGSRRLERIVLLRDEEARRTRAFVSAGDPAIPELVVGDFNMPTSSNLFQTHWGDLTCAFDSAGLGFGYTSPCRPHRYWLSGVPWIRIDHILASDQWRVLDCQTGSKNGSDHRLIAASLMRR